ncbi:hypothetical protein FKW77_001423 [Venturia effusa]|uniref:Major facilitator superfamily (MFS) profile domain-containing protein n=1 Tax=Venturia effusa TaxID=50376 RepID=A0A517L8N9_9PEZI|nr:hypothetical protein FKW77_001423 [Venturia effusa]
MEEEKARDRTSSYYSDGADEDSQSLYGKTGKAEQRGNEGDIGCLAPIRSRARARHRSHSRSQTLKTERSYGGEDGYSCNHEGHAEEGRGDGEEETEESKDRKRWEVTWDGENDPMNPRSMSVARKWAIVLILASSALCVTCVSSLYTLTYDQITVEFRCSRLIATLGVSLFVAGLGLGPMFYGRRPIYVYSYIFFLIWIIPCAVAKNITTMLVSRFINGLAGSAFLSVAGGTVGDMFAKHELSLPMMVYTASPFIGPEVGPLIGGFINQYSNWRWSFYTLLIWTAVQVALIFFFVPETYHPVLLRNKARKLRQETGEERLIAPIERLNRSIPMTIVWSCVRPFQLLALEPMCLLLCILSAILLGIIYLFFGAFAQVFGHNHGFSLSELGLSFLGLLIGMILGVSSNVLWKRNYARLVRNYSEEKGIEGSSEPEFRLPPTIVGAWIVPISLFGFGWTSFSSVHWIVPIIFSGFFGLGTIFVFSGVFTFLVDCYPLYAASALAANSFVRSSSAAAFPMFGVQMYNKLGYEWASSLLAFLALSMAP